MSLAYCVLLLVATALPAFAERSIVVELVDAAPFDARELASAMRVRLPVEGVPVRVRVSAAADGVRIEARGSVRDVKLGELGGPAAARLVALAANDLLLDDLAIATEPHATTRSPGPTVAVFGAAAAWDGTLAGLAVDIAVPRGSRTLVAVDAGGSKLLDGPLALSAAVVRGSVGVRLGILELRAGATLAPLFLDDGRDRTVLLGGGASARLRIPITPGARLVLAGGVDAFATRTTYIVDGMTVLATPRAAPWFAAGFEVTP